MSDPRIYLLPQTLAVYDGVAITNILVSLGLFWYTRHSGRSQTFLLDLGLGYEVFIALSIGLLDYAGPGPQGLSWIAAVILLFPPIVPSTPRKTLATALLASSMDPPPP